eukprot:TRINITY_DN10581_c0_g1_i2.p1 TRINITY_DN10581_c0_g1~~TRINITY_DN10581_c0_g1_i2.p1  ORF type:complete len:751 (+),score=121.10 TRINITY_DN10581_c0_g1_i2:151-2253(+)
MPLALPDSHACAEACRNEESCNLFTFHASGCSYNGEECAAYYAGGCCWLKMEVVASMAPAVNNCTCSGYTRVPKSTFEPTSPAPPGAKNLLYILVDDLRPELEAYGQSSATHHSPHMKRLADTGTVFDNAYCQIAVCSPSRMSFLTGRRPDHSRIYNFVDHFRQADCGLTEGGRRFSGPVLRSVKISDCEWGGGAPCGGSGQCCSLCSEEAGCKAWTYHHATRMCQLRASRGDAIEDVGSVSGMRGSFNTRAKWTSLPQHFKNHGWLTVSTGKIFHTEEGGHGNKDPVMNGPGMPPNEDPPSWSEGLSMQRVNDVANMWPCQMGSETSCPVDASLDGMVTHPETTKQLCDRVIADDAVVKMRLAAENLNKTGQPFFLAVGFRKPHLPFRFPAPILSLLPPEADVDVATHPTLHPSVPPIAHASVTPQANPFEAVDNATARQWRLFYRAAVSWVDSQIGRVLNEIEALGLAEDTMVVLHSDHGWSLGEHGEWQKFSNFEHGTRVPLIMRVPWLPQSQGKRTSVLAELIDIFPTMAAAMGIPMDEPEAVSLDGKSLLPVLQSPDDAAVASETKQFALSQYMRCPLDKLDPAQFWKANDCTFVDRTQMAFFGYTLRTQKWRYTEWVRWNGTTLEPDWSSQVGTELYSHDGDDGSDFNCFENANADKSHPDVVAEMSRMLHEIVRKQSRLPIAYPFDGALEVVI